MNLYWLTVFDFCKLGGYYCNRNEHVNPYGTEQSRSRRVSIRRASVQRVDYCSRTSNAVLRRDACFNGWVW
ncbi:hypothetical protein MNEG_16813 (mitochondrion) [Monoraphidium neglectum]|uniref:Uncharacterized protein n=1 Tax=Monoraphidium neglectum TaxID=145388 RepID=A0A0D2NV69_9CHLO|nr:hypothetical protein MNEG_16813 [Monoraphidium neglectum]KIZ07956.1 hypothetical protein MNEG_16813 [Monoraphidium neglectum]|eukprot:XP_013906975.1 hypothetical protein MNEG_16813 (mitochondrion) [Monoraphidium neglectum]